MIGGAEKKSEMNFFYSSRLASIVVHFLKMSTLQKWSVLDIVSQLSWESKDCLIL